MWFFDGTDEARDVLVAKHIVEQHDAITRGPFAAGGYFWLQNSPVYYYFMAILWFLGRNPVGVIVVWAILASSGILLSFWAGRLTHNTVTGLLTALLYAIHPSLITVGHQIIQPHLLPLFALLFYGSFLTALKRKSPLWLIGAELWLLLPIHFHYGSLLLWPAGGLALALTWYQAYKQRWSHWKVSLGFAGFLLLYILGAWVFLTYNYTPGDQLKFFTINANRLADPFIIRLTETAFNLKTMVFGFIPNWVGILATSGLLLGWLLERNKKFSHYLLLALVLSATFALKFRSYVAATYFLAFAPFWVLLAAQVIQTSFKLRWWLGIVVISLVGWWWRDMSLLSYSELPKVSYYQHYQQLTNAIYQDYLQQTQQQPPTSELQLAIGVLATYTGIQFDGWRIGPYWMLLEQLTHRPLVTLINFDTNFRPFSSTVKYFYFVCDRRDKPELAQTMCYDAFTQRRNYLDAGTVIFEDDAFILWRFTIDQTQLPKQFYLVYPEYM